MIKTLGKKALFKGTSAKIENKENGLNRKSQNVSITVEVESHYRLTQ